MFNAIVYTLPKPAHQMTLLERVRTVRDLHYKHPNKIKLSTKISNYFSAIRRDACWKEDDIIAEE